MTKLFVSFALLYLSVNHTIAQDREVFHDISIAGALTLNEKPFAGVDGTLSYSPRIVFHSFNDVGSISVGMHPSIGLGYFPSALESSSSSATFSIDIPAPTFIFSIPIVVDLNLGLGHSKQATRQVGTFIGAGINAFNLGGLTPFEDLPPIGVYFQVGLRHRKNMGSIMSYSAFMTYLGPNNLQEVGLRMQTDIRFLTSNARRRAGLK